MLNFERIFRHDCRILVAKILVSDFSQFYGEAPPQVVTACTRLCMFPRLLGRFFATRRENRCTFLFDHLWTKKTLPEVAASQHVAMFFPIFRKNPKNSRRTFLISVPTSGYA